MKNVLITGANGFIGKNLIWHLQDSEKYNIIKYDSNDNFKLIEDNIKNIDCIVHLAGVCRTTNVDDFYNTNENLTEKIVNLITECNPTTSMIFTSSIQVEKDNDYGKSKLLGENSVNKLPNGYVLRLHNVFGKWARENHHSVVANFCYNIANDLPIHIDDGTAQIEFIYIDDVVSKMVDIIDRKIKPTNLPIYFENRYKTTVGELAETITQFDDDLKNGLLPDTSNEFDRRLFSTFLSYVPFDKTFSLINHEDKRGNFVEVFKLQSSGQISYSTTKVGESRAGHYHHTKVEQIVVLRGKAIVKLLNLNTNEESSIILSGDKLEVAILAPGYYHIIENIGDEIMNLLIWSNCMYDESNSDTYKLR